MARFLLRLAEVFTAVVFVLIGRNDAYSSGSPADEVCVNTLPQHDGVSPQDSPAPYEVTVAKAGDQFVGLYILRATVHVGCRMDGQILRF
jgi:hypothetical protein